MLWFERFHVELCCLWIQEQRRWLPEAIFGIDLRKNLLEEEENDTNQEIRIESNEEVEEFFGNPKFIKLDV